MLQWNLLLWFVQIQMFENFALETIGLVSSIEWKCNIRCYFLNFLPLCSQIQKQIKFYVVISQTSNHIGLWKSWFCKFRLIRLREERLAAGVEEEDRLTPLPVFKPKWNTVTVYKEKGEKREIDRRSWININDQQLRYTVDFLGIPQYDLKI